MLFKTWFRRARRVRPEGDGRPSPRPAPVMEGCEPRWLMSSAGDARAALPPTYVPLLPIAPLTASARPTAASRTSVATPAHARPAVAKRAAPAAAAPAASPRVAPPAVFPIGVWYQPTYVFAYLKNLGINTLVGYESMGGRDSLEAWDAAARAQGLYMIRQPRPNPKADVGAPNLLAWTFGDEPDLHGTSARQLAKQYKAAKAADPAMPVFMNFSGGFVLGWQGALTGRDYRNDTKYADWVSSDIYPVTGWGLPNALGAPGQAVGQLARWSGYKPQMAIIETSNQDLPWVPARQRRSVSGPMFRAEVWDAIIHGARGIIYFPQRIGSGFVYYATPPDVEAEMKVQNARIGSIAGALQSPADPRGWGLAYAPVRDAAPPAGPPPRGALAPSVASSTLEGTWRRYGGKTYYIVMNTASHGVDAGITLRGAGSAAGAQVLGENRGVALNAEGFTDHFTRYETHIYLVG